MSRFDLKPFLCLVCQNCTESAQNPAKVGRKVEQSAIVEKEFSRAKMRNASILCEYCFAVSEC